MSDIVVYRDPKTLQKFWAGFRICQFRFFPGFRLLRKRELKLPMSRNNNSALSDVINSKLENSSQRRRNEAEDNEKNKPGNLVKDPVRCPLCLARLMCPRGKDYEEFLDQKLLRCLTSKDPICHAATTSARNAEYIQLAQVRIKASKLQP